MAEAPAAGGAHPRRAPSVGASERRQARRATRAPASARPRAAGALRPRDGRPVGALVEKSIGRARVVSSAGDDLALSEPCDLWRGAPIAQQHPNPAQRRAGGTHRVMASHVRGGFGGGSGRSASSFRAEPRDFVAMGEWRRFRNSADQAPTEPPSRSHRRPSGWRTSTMDPNTMHSPLSSSAEAWFLQVPMPRTLNPRRIPFARKDQSPTSISGMPSAMAPTCPYTARSPESGRRVTRGLGGPQSAGRGDSSRTHRTALHAVTSAHQRLADRLRTVAIRW